MHENNMLKHVSNVWCQIPSKSLSMIPAMPLLSPFCFISIESQPISCRLGGLTRPNQSPVFQSRSWSRPAIHLQKTLQKALQAMFRLHGAKKRATTHAMHIGNWRLRSMLVRIILRDLKWFAQVGPEVLQNTWVPVGCIAFPLSASPRRRLAEWPPLLGCQSLELLARKGSEKK